MVQPFLAVAKFEFSLSAEVEEFSSAVQASS